MTKQKTNDSHLEELNKELIKMEKNIREYLKKKDHTKEEKDEFLKCISKTSKKYNYLHKLHLSENDRQGKESKEYKQLMTGIDLFFNDKHLSCRVKKLINNTPFSERNKILRYLLNIAIKKLYFKDKYPSTLIKPIDNILEKHYKESTVDINIVINDLKNISNEIRNDELEALITKRNIRTYAARKKIKFILKEIFNHTCSNDELEIEDDLVGIELEHILPKTICGNSQWAKEFSDNNSRKEYTYQVGNLTLLEAIINSCLGNKDFCIKRVGYRYSKIKENRMIAHLSQWTTREIDCRAQILSIRIIEYLEFLIRDIK